MILPPDTIRNCPSAMHIACLYCFVYELLANRRYQIGFVNRMIQELTTSRVLSTYLLFQTRYLTRFCAVNVSARPSSVFAFLHRHLNTSLVVPPSSGLPCAVAKLFFACAVVVWTSSKRRKRRDVSVTERCYVTKKYSKPSCKFLFRSYYALGQIE